MATISMNVESCRNLNSNINSTREALNQQVESLAGSVNGLVGADWIAPSAVQFQEAFQQWSTTMRQMFDQLNELNNRLNAEIADFEDAASRLA